MAFSGTIAADLAVKWLNDSTVMQIACRTHRTALIYASLSQKDNPETVFVASECSLSSWKHASGRLQPVFEPKSHSAKLQVASELGYADCVAFLITKCNPRANKSKALCLAASNGHIECVNLLIPVSDPKANGSRALCLATENGHEACVDRLIPLVDPTF